MRSEMRHLFSPEGEAALAATMALRPMLAFDFDGTLAPIVTRPESAGVPLPVARRLQRLAHALPMAIITGRAVDDVRARLAFEPHHVIGNHGAEDPELAPAVSASMLDGVRDRLDRHERELASLGIVVEDKRLSIALHYRLARDRHRAMAAISALVDGLGPELRIFGGKLVVNLMPTQAPDKAIAVMRLLQRCDATCALFVGDDINDEPVFAAAPPDWLTVRVGRDLPDSRARFFLDSTGEVASMLERMLLLLPPHPPHRG